MPRKAGPILYLEVDMGYSTPCHIPVRADGVPRATDGMGYVQTTYRKGQPRTLHRRAWIEANGPIPEGMALDHLCRHRPCCNAAHLEPVTDTENLRRGNLAKIDMVAAIQIRARVAAGESQASVARSMQLSKSHVSNIVTGKYWTEDGSPSYRTIQGRQAKPASGRKEKVPSASR